MSKKSIYSPAYRRLIQRLRARRLELEMTQAQLAAKVGKDRAWVQRVLACETRTDFLQTVDLLKALKIDIHEAVRLVQGEAP
jgi:transcriptional regulator with XRE-family HTH domain